MVNIHLDPTLSYFATSDPHIGHKNIIKFCGRPFSDIAEMEETIVTNYNNVVGKKDITFLVGDIIWSNSGREFNKFMNRLNGYKIIVPGNHDKPSCFKSLPGDCVVSQDIVFLYINNFPKYVLSHFPLVTYSGIERGCINLHGHIHSGPLSTSGFDTSFKSPNHIDIGVDNQNFTPFHIKLN